MRPKRNGSAQEAWASIAKATGYSPHMVTAAHTAKAWRWKRR